MLKNHLTSMWRINYEETLIIIGRPIKRLLSCFVIGSSMEEDGGFVLMTEQEAFMDRQV